MDALETRTNEVTTRALDAVSRIQAALDALARTQAAMDTKSIQGAATPSEAFVHIQFHNQPFDWIFDDMQLHELEYDKAIVTIPPDALVSNAMRSMIDCDVTCALVVSEATGSLCGIVDAVDIVRAIMAHGCGPKRVDAVIRYCTIAPADLRVFQLIPTLIHGPRYVAYEHNGAYHLTSQGCILRCLHKKEGVIERLNDEVRHMQRASSICTAHATESVGRGFELMVAHSMAILGIVDGDGTLVSVLSSTDALHVNDSDMTLNKNIVAFVTDARERSKRHATRDVSSVVCCVHTDDIRSVLEKMVVERVHNVFLVDETRRPLGVVSMVEILSHVYHHEAATIRGSYFVA